MNIKKFVTLSIAVTLIIASFGGIEGNPAYADENYTPTAESTETATPTPSASPSNEPSEIPEETPSVEPDTPSPSLEQSNTPNPTPTESPASAPEPSEISQPTITAPSSTPSLEPEESPEPTKTSDVPTDIVTPSETSSFAPTAAETSIPTENINESENTSFLESIVTTSDGIVFDTSTGSITGYTGSAVILDIPNIISNIEVANITTSAFADSLSLEEVTIPSSITRIEESAFSNCNNLSKVIIYCNPWYMGNNIFYGCDDITINGLPNTFVEAYADLNNIAFLAISFNDDGNDLFEEAATVSVGLDEGYNLCAGDVDYYEFVPTISGEYEISSVSSLSTQGNIFSLNQVMLASDNAWGSVGERNFLISYELISGQTYYIRVNGYENDQEGDYSIRIVGPEDSIEGLVFDESTGTITDYTGTATTLDIPSTISGVDVVALGDSAFYQCHTLTSIVIPSSVTSIGYAVFADCDNLTNITVSDSNPNFSSVDGILFNKYKSAIICYPGSRTGSSYTIPSSVQIIVDYSLSDCDNLTSVTIPGSVTNIGYAAFYKSDNLSSVLVGDGVVIIQDYAFYQCNSLSSIDLPYGTTSIGYATFADCENFTSITIPESVTSIDANAFTLCPSNLVIYGISGSYAETYAAIEGITFEAIINGDGNESYGEAIQLSIGLSSTYDLYVGDTDYYIFEPTDSGLYEIESEGLTDTYGYLMYDYGTGYSVFDLDNSSGDSNNFKLEYTLTAGSTYYIKVSENGDDASGDYNIRITKTADDSNDSFAEAVTVDARVNGPYDFCMGDHDYYEFQANVSGEHVFSSEGSLDTLAKLYNSSQSEIAHDEVIVGDENNFSITYTLTAGATYYIRVGTFEDSDFTQDYYISVTEPETSDGNDSFGEALTISVGLNEGYSLYLGDSDYYKFIPSLSGEYEMSSESSLDTLGSLYNASQSLIASNDDSGDSYNFKITYELAAGQIYYIKVKGYGDDEEGDYNLKIIAPESIITTDDGLEFDANTGTITDYTGTATTLYIPSTINEISVVAIGMYAFAQCTSLNNITIPSSVTSIGEDAFDYCSSTLIIYGVSGSYADTYCDNNSITFYGYTDSYGSGVMGRTYTRPDGSTYSVTYYDGSSAADPKIQADYYDEIGVMFFTEQFGDDGTIVASIWFHEGTIVPSVKNYYDDGTLYFQEEYDTSNILIASVSYHADGVSRYFKNYYDNGTMYFQEEYDTDGEMIASIWFQEDGVTRNFKNYYSGYLYFQEEYNTDGTMIASINFRSDFTRERKCYYRVSDGSLYLIEYYDENEVCFASQWYN